jgi:hypothetical protein
VSALARVVIVCSAAIMNRRLSEKLELFARFCRQRWVVIALAVIYVYAFPYFTSLRHANELPRIMTTVQLVERGTFRLDERIHDLGSRADISTTPDGRSYQNKAPGLSMLGVVVYYPLSLGYRAAGRTPPMMLSTWLLRFSLVSLPAIAFLAAFRRILRRFTESEEAQNGGLIAYALGSMALPYGLLFMSHALAASLVGFAFALALRSTRDRDVSETRAALGAGALLGLSMLTEYQALFGALIVAGYFVLGAERRLRVAALIGASAVPFLATLAIYHQRAFGSPFRTGYAYSVDVANRVGIMGIVGPSQESIGQLLWHVDNGLLLLSPWVVLSIVGAIAIARSVELRARVGREAVVAALIVVVYTVFVASLEPSFGRAGWSVGPRYMAVAMPFVALLAASGLEVCLRHSALRVPAMSLVLMGAFIFVLAATTYPHWPTGLENPLFETSVRLLREGHAPHSLGTFFGLRGLASLVPLYLGALSFAVYLLSPKRETLLEVALAVLLAAFAVSRYGRLAATPRAYDEAMWRFVSSTTEP